MSLDKDITNSFWEKYFNADHFGKRELLKSLPLIKSAVEKVDTKKMDKDLYEYFLVNLFQDYIEDAVKFVTR